MLALMVLAVIKDDTRYGPVLTGNRCDEKCHNAVGEECDCICLGRNHGVGLAQAMANTKAIDLGLLDEWGIRKTI